jgi:hypothetical protein
VGNERRRIGKGSGGLDPTALLAGRSQLYSEGQESARGRVDDDVQKRTEAAP